MFDRNDGQSLTMRQAGQEQYQQESGGSSRSSSGSDGRSGRRGQPHQIRSARQSNSATVVPAFTIRSASQGRVQPPKRVNVFAERPSPSLAFRRIYQRGDLPVCIVHESRLYRLGWKVTEKPVIFNLKKTNTIIPRRVDEKMQLVIQFFGWKRPCLKVK